MFDTNGKGGSGWTALPSMDVGRGRHGCAVVEGGGLMVVGGSGRSREAERSVEFLSFGESVQGWRRMPNMNVSRCGTGQGFF